MNRTLMIGAVLAGLAAGGWAWHARAGRAAAEAAGGAERARLAAMRGGLAREEQRVAQARANSEAAQAKLAVGATPPLPTGKAPEGGKKSAGAASFAEAMRNAAKEHDRPEEQVRRFEQRRATNRRKYEGLFRQLGLSEAQREQLVRNFSEREERHSDLNAAARAFGIDLSAPEIAKARGELYAEHEKAQKALLGEAGYRAMEDYDRTSGMRESVANLAGLAAVAGVPLTPGQADALVRALAETVPQYRRGGTATLSDAELPAVDAALAQVLTPEQLTVFKTQEAPGGAGGIFHARWNGELSRAMAAERAKGKK